MRKCFVGEDSARSSNSRGAARSTRCSSPDLPKMIQPGKRKAFRGHLTKVTKKLKGTSSRAGLSPTQNGQYCTETATSPAGALSTGGKQCQGLASSVSPPRMPRRPAEQRCPPTQPRNAARPTSRPLARESGKLEPGMYCTVTENARPGRAGGSVTLCAGQTRGPERSVVLLKRRQ